MPSSSVARGLKTTNVPKAWPWCGAPVATKRGEFGMARVLHRLAGERFGQPRRQPVSAGRVQPDGILRCKTPAAVLNDEKIRHLLPCLLQGKSRDSVRYEKKNPDN